MFARFLNITPRRIRLSIRSRLVILALLVVVPLMLDRVRLLESSRTERIHEASAEVLDLAKHGAAGQRDIITTARAMLQVVARAHATMLARGETCNLYMKDLAGKVPWISGLSIIGRDGRVVCSTSDAAIGLDMSDRPHYREALRTGDFVVSDYLIGRGPRTPMIVAAYPVQAIDANASAVIMASIELQWITPLVAALERRGGATVKLIDGAGTLLAGNPHIADWIGNSVRDTALFKAIGDRAEGTVRAEGLDGIRRIFGFVRLPSSDARLVIGLPEADLLGSVDREIMVAYLQLGFIGLLVLMVARFVGDRLIVDPIRALARTAARFGHGDLAVRPDQSVWAKEFEPLAAALNDMAGRLAERERELRAANRHLEQLASIDPLSGLANRRGFDARLAATWQRAGKLGQPVALLMVDVDHFKLFNDRYGHVEGDVCLRLIGKLMMDAARGPDDMPARYGGEEFALLLPGADIDAARTAGELVRRSVEELCITHEGSPLGQVTISVGIASVSPSPGEQPERLVEAADAGLYAAKRRGRNAAVEHGMNVLAMAS